MKGEEECKRDRKVENVKFRKTERARARERQ